MPCLTGSATRHHSGSYPGSKPLKIKSAILAAAFTALVPALALAAGPAAITPDVIAPTDAPLIQATMVSAPPAPVPGAPATAPMPDADAGAPVAAADDPAPKVQPAFYATQKDFRGDGFAFGSTAQGVQDGSSKPAAGLALNVPLD